MRAEDLWAQAKAYRRAHNIRYDSSTSDIGAF